MLGILLLGTEILFVSALKAPLYISTSETCSELLKSWDNETFIFKYQVKMNSVRVEVVHASEDHDIQVVFKLQKSISWYGQAFREGPICFGVREMRIRSRRRDGDEGEALVVLGTNPVIPVAGLLINNRSRVDLYSTPGFMESAPLKHSPLTEEFWTSFNDNNTFNKNWLGTMDIRTIKGNIPSQWVSHLTSVSLVEMHISGNDWRRPDKLLGYLPNLWSLNLTDNNIEVLPNDTFSGTPNLAMLHLSGNRLLQLPIGLEIPLFEFSLENQRERSVFQISDHDLPSLKMVYSIILRNVTVRIDLCNSSEVVHLKEIEVVNSEILTGWKEEMHCNASLQTIEKIMLPRNNLSVLPSNAIKLMINIRYLDVQHNRLTDCQGNLLGLLRELEYLDMSNNRLHTLTEDCFHGLEHLSRLSLSENEIVSVEGGTFAGLISLTNLDLSFNKLINIHSSAFLPVDREELFKPLRIRELDLSSNKLNEFILWTQSMVNITNLKLSNNSIRRIQVVNVHNLNLSYNTFDHIPDGLVTIPQDLKSVDFGGNNIACCHPNNKILADPTVNITVTMYNLGTRELFSCFLYDQKLILHSVLFNTSFCSDSTSNVELWLSLGVFTAATAVFMSFVYYYRTELAYLSHFANKMKEGIRTDEEKYNDAAYDAFVCYCGKNFPWIVRHLLRSVEGTDEGYRLCIHERDFTLGAAIDTNVLTALDRSRKVIFVLSRDFMASKWCRWELEMATHKMFDEERNYIILIELESLEGVVLPKQLKYLMKTRKFFHWPEDSASEPEYAKFWKQVRRALGRSLFRTTGMQLPKMSVLEIEE